MDTNTTDLVSSFSKHQPAVYAYFRRMGAQPADAADLAQATFLEALRGIERFRGESTVRTWLLGIARNVFRGWLRSRRVEVELTESNHPDSDDESDDIAVRAVLDQLRTADREILVFFYAEGLHSKEIAAMLGISDTAVRQRIARAADAFRELWRSS